MKNASYPRCTAILLAGGTGSRVGMDKPKQWFSLRGKTVFRRTLEVYDSVEEISDIVVVIRPEDEELAREQSRKISKRVEFTYGADTRAASAKNGFFAIKDNTDYVAIADVARCLIHKDDIARVVRCAWEYGAASAVATVSDTVKLMDEDGIIAKTVPRDLLRLAQTPQVFRFEDYRRALSQTEDLSSVTDDNMLLERIGVPVRPVLLMHENPKLTSREDIALFEAYLYGREHSMMGQYRVGHGYDVHRLVEGRRLVLGGVEIPHTLGLLGHSDADVLLHAIMDSILGALGLGDIGRHFPDTSEEFLGISSVNLLTRVAAMMRQRGAEVVNLDATLVLQRPKIAPYINNMVENIAFALGADPALINIKATTEEHLGFTGREEGVSATAVCMLSVSDTV